MKNRVVILLSYYLFVMGQQGWAQSPSQVADLNPDALDGMGGGTFSWQGKLYFYGRDSLNAIELCYYNEVSPPSTVYRVNPGLGLMAFSKGIISFKNNLYYSIRVIDTISPAEDKTLYVYDGVNPPVQAPGFTTDLFKREPGDLTVVNNELFFSATRKYQPSLGPELWHYDGVNPPAQVEISALGATPDPSNLIEFQGQLFFNALGANALSCLICVDPATDSVRIIKTSDHPAGFEIAEHMLVSGGRLYFTATGSHGYDELFSYDGVVGRAETNLSSSTHLGAIGPLAAYKAGIYFIGPLGDSAYCLFRHDTSTGINTPISTSPRLGYYGDFHEAFVYNDILYFGAVDTLLGSELWRFDGTSVSLVADLCPGKCDGFAWGNPVENNNVFCVLNSHLYFIGNDGTHGWEMWRIGGDTTIQNPASVIGLTVHPVPAQYEVVISMKLTTTQQIRVVLTDMQGREAYNSGLSQYEAGNASILVPLNQLQNGQFLYRISNGGGQLLFCGKVMKN